MYAYRTYDDTPDFRIDPNGFKLGKREEKGEWYKNLIHWLDVNDQYLENLERLGPGYWNFKFNAFSPTLFGEDFSGYIDVCDHPGMEGCYVELGEYLDHKVVGDEATEAFVNSLNKDENVKFSLDQNYFRCVVTPKNPSPKRFKHYDFDRLIYQCYAEMDAVMTHPEIAQWSN